MNKSRKLLLLRRIGWSVYIVKCADGTYFSGMARDMVKELYRINILKKGHYFNRGIKRTPVKIVFEEKHLPFREAYSKFCYLRKMNRRDKERLIRKKKWADGWQLYKRKLYES